MRPTDKQITSTDELKVGDTFIIAWETDEHIPATTEKATVAQKLKTKFKLEFEDGSKAEYSTRMVDGTLVPDGQAFHDGIMRKLYTGDDEVLAWSEREKRRADAYTLCWEIYELAKGFRHDVPGNDGVLDTAREIAHMAQLLVEEETRIAEFEHEHFSREED